MSFGFSVGDFIAAIELANKIRKEFVGSPSQFKDISDEVTSLAIVLNDVEIVLSGLDLNVQQKTELRDITNGCQNVLNGLGKILDKYGELRSNPGSVGKKAKRVWKRLRWEPEDIKELRSRIITNVTLLNTFQGRLTSQISLETKDGVDRLHERQDNRERREERQAVLDSLTPIDYASQQSGFIGRRQAGTGQWFLDSAAYQAWLKTSKQTLFSPGIPGAGKTILTAVVVHNLTTQFSDHPAICIAYIYFRRQCEQKIDNLLASLLKQLAEGQSSLPDSVKDLVVRHKVRGTRPLVDEISRCLQSVATMYSRVFIVIDALDECQLSSGCKTRFLLEMFSLQAKCGVNLFATSRFIPEILEKFEGSVRLEIHASKEDVRTYLDHHFWPRRAFLRKNLELQEEIKAKIVEAVEGMFLLAQFHLDSLIEMTTESDIQSALESLRTGSDAYDQAYKDAMERIKQQGTEGEKLAKQALWWITCARRPLITVELQHAIAVKPGKSKFNEKSQPDIEDIVSVCAGLVTVDEESNIIRLVHYTAQEYFERTQKRWFPDAETNIAKTCITYLLFDTFQSGLCPTDEEFEARLRENALYDYAAKNWGHHARRAPLSSEMIMEFLESDPKVEASIQALMGTKRYSSHANYSQEVPRYMTGSHLAAHLGLEEAMKELLIRGHKLNLKDSDLRSPLSWAARSGHDAIIAFLSAQGITGIDSKDKLGQTPLSHAAGNGHEAAVKLLLTKDDVDPDSRDNFSRTPLSRAAMFGHAAVVELLLAQDDVDPDPEDDNSETPLVLAAMYGHDAVVKLLLDTGKVVPEFKDAKYGRTPLSWVAERGNTALVEKLLRIDGVNPDSKSAGSWNKGRTPLSYAAEGGHRTVVELLMATGRVNLDLKDNDGRTPLSYAIAEAQTETLHFLLGYGASPTTIDIQLKGFLHYAIVNVNCTFEIVKTLLMLDAPTNLVDIDNMTPLHYTVRFNRQDIAKFLIQNGVPVDISIHRKAWISKNHEGRTIFEPGRGHEIPSVDPHCTRGLTPLHYAALVGNCQMVQFFLDQGANPNAVTYYGETPLHLTLCKNVHGTKYNDDWTQDHWRAEVLLDFIDPEDDDADEIYADISRRRMAVIDMLLNHPKADVEVRDTEGASALHRAPYGKPECAIIVSKLIEKGAEVSAWNLMKQCPLHLACRRGDSASVQVLLSHSVDILYVDHDGLNAFHYAAISRNMETMSRILEASDTSGLNISASRDKRGRNALHHMLAHGANIGEVKFLLDKGVDVKDRDINGNSPLASYLINSRFYIDDGICRLLLRSGSNRLAVNDQGLALAHLSSNCLKMNIAVLKALMDFDVDIEILDTQGRTLLHHTALKGSLTETALTFLLKKTMLRPDDRDFSGKTPLQYAAEQAGEKRHRSVFDSQRWSRSLKILMRNEAVAG